MSTNRIRTAREAAGLSQAELADRLDMQPSHLSRIELGAGITLKTAQRIAAALNTDTCDLFPIEAA